MQPAPSSNHRRRKSLQLTEEHLILHNIVQRCQIRLAGSGHQVRHGGGHHTADHAVRGAGARWGAGVGSGPEAAVRRSDKIRRSMRSSRGTHVHCFPPRQPQAAGRPVGQYPLASSSTANASLRAYALARGTAGRSLRVTIRDTESAAQGSAGLDQPSPACAFRLQSSGKRLCLRLCSCVRMVTAALYDEWAIPLLNTMHANDPLPRSRCSYTHVSRSQVDIGDGPILHPAHSPRRLCDRTFSGTNGSGEVGCV